MIFLSRRTRLRISMSGLSWTAAETVTGEAGQLLYRLRGRARRNFESQQVVQLPLLHRTPSTFCCSSLVYKMPAPRSSATARTTIP